MGLFYADFQHEKYYRTVVGLDDDGLVFVDRKKHRIGRYEYLTRTIPAATIRSVLITKSVVLQDVAKGILLAFMGLLFLATMREGMDWGWKMYAIAPLAPLAGIGLVLTSRKTIAIFHGDRSYRWIGHDRDTAFGIALQIQEWCARKRIDVVDRLAADVSRSG